MKTNIDHLRIQMVTSNLNKIERWIMVEDGNTKKRKGNPPNPSRHPKDGFLWLVGGAWLPNGMENPECLTLMQRPL